MTSILAMLPEGERMKSKNRDARYQVRKTTGVIIICVALLGGLIFSISFIPPASTLKELFRELGVVLFTVCGVSMIYEIFISEKHFKDFFAILKNQIERGESNAAICEKLGIREIFERRDKFEAKYSFGELTAEATIGTTIRIVGRTLYLVLNKPEVFKLALKKGSSIELCFFNPETNPHILEELAYFIPSDTQAAIHSFNRDFLSWFESERPIGNFEIRYHDVHLLESYLTILSDNAGIAVWDLSFGRDVTAKRIFLLDTTIGLGQNLGKRYDKIWNMSNTMFKYKNKKISINNLLI
jgi:hypothetical protein